jgi:xanthine dehydrogenase YagR molybdenum-binding subunit
MPEVDAIWIDEPDPHAPMGARGVGEIGITGLSAAVANARCSMRRASVYAICL